MGRYYEGYPEETYDHYCEREREEAAQADAAEAEAEAQEQDAQARANAEFDALAEEHFREQYARSYSGEFCDCRCGCRPHTGDFGPCACASVACRCKSIPDPFCKVGG